MSVIEHLGVACLDLSHYQFTFSQKNKWYCRFALSGDYDDHAVSTWNMPGECPLSIDFSLPSGTKPHQCGFKQHDLPHCPCCFDQESSELRDWRMTAFHLFFWQFLRWPANMFGVWLLMTRLKYGMAWNTALREAALRTPERWLKFEHSHTSTIPWNLRIIWLQD